MPKVALRAVNSEDLATLFEHQTDAQANQMAVFGSKNPFDEAAFLSRWQRIRADNDIVVRIVTVDNHVAGYVAHFEQLGKPSISYWIGRAFWGKGVASEAVTQFTQIIDSRPLFARVALSNEGSIRVLIKNGFKRIATENSYSDVRDALVEEAIYSLEHKHDK